MPRTCTICSHADRSAIEEALVTGVSYRHIASQFQVGYKSVERHAVDHIAQAVQQSQAAKEEAHSLDVVGQLKQINTITLAILHAAQADEEKHGLALQAIDRVCKQLELQGKLLGAIETPQINILISPEWHRIRSTIIAALLAYPDARIAVAAALLRLEDEQHGSSSH